MKSNYFLLNANKNIRKEAGNIKLNGSKIDSLPLFLLLYLSL